MALFNTHTGSWGLPDFGITELFSGGNLTAQGGSNLLPGGAPTAIVDNQPIQGAGLGWAGATDIYDPNKTTTPPAPTTTSTPTGGSGGGSGVVPTQPALPNVPTLDDINRQIDEIYNPSMNYLSQAENQLRSDFPQVQKDIEGQFATSRDTLNANLDQAKQTFGEADTQARQRRDDAANASVRLLNELRRAGIQRFGGASSAGEAYEALTNTEFQRTRAAQERDLSNTLNKIQLAKANTETQYRNNLLALDREKQLALNEAQRDFNNKLLELTRLKSETQSAKSSARLELLQQLRNQIFQINLQTTQFQQALAAQRGSNLQQLSLFEQQAISNLGVANQSVQTLGQSASMTTNPQTAMTIQTPGTTLSNPNMYIGQRKDEEEALA